MAWGIAYAGAYTLIAIVLYVMSPPPHSPSLEGVILSYFAGGVAAGSIVGLLRPLLRGWPGAAFVGLVAAFPVVYGFGLLLEQSGEGTVTWLFVVIAAFAMGPLSGVLLWHRLKQLTD